MIKLFMFILVSLASLVIATAEDVNSFTIHTNDPEPIANIDLNSFHDFAKSPEGKNISADGNGLTLGGVYKHSKDESVKLSGFTMNNIPTNGESLPFNDTSSKVSVNDFIHCFPTICNGDKDITFNDKIDGPYLYSQFGGFLANMIGQPSYGDGVSAVFNNVMCSGGTPCSIWMGISVWVVPNSDPNLSALVSIAQQELLATQMACQGSKTGGQTFCDIKHPDNFANPGVFSYWWKPMEGPAWGYPCPNTDQWTQLVCGHYLCDSTGRCKITSS